MRLSLSSPLACRFHQDMISPDFICSEDVIVELKAFGGLTGVEEAQVLNYLKVCHLRRGLLLNFGTPSLEYRRFVFG